MDVHMIRMAVDVAVIGAGFSGSLLALMLHRAGRRVVRLETGCTSLALLSANRRPH